MRKEDSAIRKLSIYVVTVVLLGTAIFSSAATAPLTANKQAANASIQELIRELSMPQPEDAENGYDFSAFLFPKERLEKSKLTLITFFGLVSILTLRVFFFMHEKKKKMRRDTQASKTELQHANYKHFSPRSNKSFRLPVAMPVYKSLATIEGFYCNVMYQRQPRVG